MPSKISLVSVDGVSQYGLRVISALLKENGHLVETVFLDSDALLGIKRKKAGLLVNELAKKCAGSLFVGVSSNMCANDALTRAVLAGLRKKGFFVVLGGINPSLNPKELLGLADALFIGESEDALLEFTKKFEKGEDFSRIKNLCTTVKGKPVANGIRPLREDLDSLPFADYSFEGQYKIGASLKAEPLSAADLGNWCNMHTLRGCPMCCSYCSNSKLNEIYGNTFYRVRKMRVPRVIRELEGVREKGFNYVWFTDDIFTLRTEAELKEFAELYPKKVGLPFQCYVSPSTVSREKIRCLVKAGVDQIEMGVQSGSERLNREVYKRFQDNKTVIKAAKTLSGFAGKMRPPSYQFITANPYEEAQDVLDSINLIQEISFPFITSIFNLSFFRGSHLAERAIADKKIGPKDLVWKETRYHDHATKIRQTRKTCSAKQFYYYALLYLMAGNATKFRIGLFPRPLLSFLAKHAGFFSKFNGFFSALFLFRRHPLTEKLLGKNQ